MSIFDKVKNAFSGSNDEENQVVETERHIEETIVAPMDGEVRDIKESADGVFAQEIVGKGVMIIPSLGKVFAPVDGKVSMIAETGHAIGITSDSGLEILIHIGLDTVELQGKPFTNKTTINSPVKKGDLLIEFNIDDIKNSGKETQSPVIITNTDSLDIEAVKFGLISHGEDLLKVSSN